MAALPAPMELHHSHPEVFRSWAWQLIMDSQRPDLFINLGITWCSPLCSRWSCNFFDSNKPFRFWSLYCVSPPWDVDLGFLNLEHRCRPTSVHFLQAVSFLRFLWLWEKGFFMLLRRYLVRAHKIYPSWRSPVLQSWVNQILDLLVAVCFSCSDGRGEHGKITDG